MKWRHHGELYATDDTSSKPEDTLAQGKAVRGARKRKLPSQTTSPIASRLRAKQIGVVAFVVVAVPNSSRMGQDTAGSAGHAAGAKMKGAATTVAARRLHGGGDCREPGSRSVVKGTAAIGVMGSLSRSSPARTLSGALLAWSAEKQVRQEQAQQGSPPPPNGNGGKPPPRWSGSPAALSRSRIMLDAAMRNQVPSGRHVSFADPPVQGEYEIGPRKARFSRALYEEPEMDEGELADSQQPLWPSLEGCTEPVDAVLPLLTSSLWLYSLLTQAAQPWAQAAATGRDDSGGTGIDDLCKALQLPVRAPRVASLRKALEQYAAALQDGSPLNEASPLQDASSVTQSASLELPVHSEEVPSTSSNSTGRRPGHLMEDETEIACSPSSEPKESMAAPTSLHNSTSQSDEDAQTIVSCGVQCCPLRTEGAVQTGPVVLSKLEVCQLLTPDFFASLERAELGRILSTIATVVAQNPLPQE
ncbi:hypothetical protein HPB49_026142 [Dermacentor silvarum]|nr:hypothetical protein HPB49_026142 [Dermacentor silvarum]